MSLPEMLRFAVVLSCMMAMAFLLFRSGVFVCDWLAFGWGEAVAMLREDFFIQDDAGGISAPGRPGRPEEGAPRPHRPPVLTRGGER